MRLANVELRAKKSPKTFFIPSLEERKSLKRGDFALLIFNNRERMWVKVSKKAEGGYAGTLSNDPVVVDMNFGDPVEFKYRHIADIRFK
jgi:uncharacterized protein YegJ (DUF2314 family)